MKLNYKKVIFTGFAFFLICAFWQAYDNVIPLILTNKFGMNQTWSGVIMALDNLFALFLLPLFGALSDKTNTKFGRRTPYIFIGTICAVLVFIFLPLIDTLWLFILALLLVLLSMSIFRSPAVALMPDVTCKPYRSKANAVINLMGTAGGMIVLVFGTIFKTSEEHKTDFFPYILATAGLMLLGLIVFLLTVREKKWAAEMIEDAEKYFPDKEEEERKLRKAEYEAGVADGLNTAKKDAAIAFAELHVPIEQIALALKVDVEAVKKWLRETGK